MAKSNLAYKQDYYGYAITREKRSSNLRIKSVPKKTNVKEVKRAVKKMHKPQRGEKLFAALVVVLAFMMLARGVTITKKHEQINNKKAELNKMQTTNQKMQIEIESALNLKNVEEIALNELNMARPEKNQTVYIKIDQDDVVEKTNSSKIKEGVGNFFSSIKAYLD